MTKLATRKRAAKFETSSQVFSRGHKRSVMVECREAMLVLRLKDHRTCYAIEWDKIYWIAQNRAALAQRVERRRQRAALKRGEA